jgi:UDP-N-acetylmuramoyl-L-alanyl-D-glutamate--2,6-diaminopimelate ligase
MGKTAARFADWVVVTNDNPRHENPQQIVDDICSDISDANNVRVEPDRRSAIKMALDKAAVDDVVLIAGKGSEDYQIIGDDRIPLSDVVIAAEHVRGLSS